jgi:hypothetical protein
MPRVLSGFIANSFEIHRHSLELLNGWPCKPIAVARRHIARQYLTTLGGTLER